MQSLPAVQVIYNRAARQWQAQNGKVIGVFPAGPVGKRDAQLCALEHDHRALWKEVEWIRQVYALDAQGDAIETRVIKAAQSVAAGHILPAYDYDQDYGAIARVISQGDAGQSYTIAPDSWSDGHLQCTCDDFAFRAPYLRSGQRACKHILAYHLAEALEQHAYEVEEFEARLQASGAVSDA